jgi:hypothetical protein
LLGQKTMSATTAAAARAGMATGQSGFGGGSAPLFNGGASGTGNESLAAGFGGGGGEGVNSAGFGGGGGGGGYTGGGGGGSYAYSADVTAVSSQSGVNGAPDANGAAGGLNGYVDIAPLGVGPAPVDFSSTGAIQAYTITQTDTYVITVAGAQGGGIGGGRDQGFSGGYGALMSGDVFLESGTILGIVVGGAGPSGSVETAGDGGGGSFVWVQPPIAAAAAPEPSTWAMMLAGFIGLGFAAFSRKRANGRAPSPACGRGPG